MILPELSLSSWAGITAAFALLAGFWRNAVGVARWFSSLIICRTIIKDEAARAVMTHCWKHGRRSPFGVRAFGGLQHYVFPHKRVEVVAFEGVTSDPTLFFFGRVPALVCNGLTGKQHESINIGRQCGDINPVIIWSIRGTLDLDGLIEQAVTEFNQLRQQRVAGKMKEKRFNVFRMDGDGGYAPTNAGSKSDEVPTARSNMEEMVSSIQHGELRLISWKFEDLIERNSDMPPFSLYPTDPEVLAQFDEIDTWLKKEEWFRAKGVPWRRGYLLYGPPGAGRSTLVKNLAIKHDLPIYSFDLSTFSNRSFVNAWKNAQQNAPAIVLLEDIDSVFLGRTNCLQAQATTKQLLTFDCLLNTISGVGSCDGILLFVTTNKVETLDSALGTPNDGNHSNCSSSRPGRLDRCIYLGEMKEPQRRKLANLILGEWPDVVDGVVAAGDGEMAAQFQERCVREATKLFWTRGGVECDPPKNRGAATISVATTVDRLKELFDEKDRIMS
jgi:hypothetical protein